MTLQTLLNDEQRVICGDALDVLKTLDSESVDCVITSPPYFGLRDYGNAGQIGLEETPELYVAKLVAVFQEVKRVLKKEGTFWLNLGDSYASSREMGTSDNGTGTTTLAGPQATYKSKVGNGISKIKASGLKQKDLIGIPWRVAFALQADGWYLRQDIIWAKPNPMPESVTDRCTKSHEYIFLLTKSPKYFYDADAIKERAVCDLDGNGTIKRADRQREGLKSNPDETKNGIRHKNMQEKGQPLHTMHKLRVMYPNGKDKDGQQSPKVVSGYRNKRSVWTITTKGYPEAHFATFPFDLVEPMILAGCPQKVIDCNKCGVVLGYGNGTKGVYKLREVWSSMREIQLEKGAEILQQVLRFFMDSKESENDERIFDNEQGVQDDTHSGASIRGKRRIHNGASSGHGEGLGPLSDQRRSGTSSELEQTGQPARKLGGDEQENARQTSVGASEADHLPSLWKENKVIGTHSKCGGNIRVRQGIVLDCFSGAGTTGVVAKKFGRNYIGIELNPEYIKMSEKRINALTPPMF